MKCKILIATTNQGKSAELAAMLDANVQWLSLADFANIEKVKEDGQGNNLIGWKFRPIKGKPS